MTLCEEFVFNYEQLFLPRRNAEKLGGRSPVRSRASSAIPSLLYQAWCGWCTEQGQDHPGVKQTFGRNLHAVIPGLRPMRPRNGKDRWRGYQGVALR
jgi:hypothetical protein